MGIEIKDSIKMSKANPAKHAEALAFFDNLAKAYQEKKITEREVAKIDAAKSVLICNIKEKYGFYRDVLEKIFSERTDIMHKHFEIIERGLSSNDNDLILYGLQGLSHLVSTSPFANIDKLTKMIEDNTTIEI